MKNLFDIIKYDDQGLITAVIQHCDTGQILMVGYMNEEALKITLREKAACFWSRSRQELWRKGETSGNTLAVEEIRTDCDADALVLKCRPAGPPCPTNEPSSCPPGGDEEANVTLAGDGIATE